MTVLTHMERRALYGEFSGMMADGEKTRDDMVDRAAYVYITGQFPSHLRKHYTGVLRSVTNYFKRPAALDGRTGSIKLDGRVALDLELEKHPMVREVRSKLAQGYLIQPSRGFGTRRPFWRIYMFLLDGTRTVEQITVQGDGSTMRGWK